MYKLVFLDVTDLYVNTKAKSIPFKKPAKEMMPEAMSPTIQEEWNKFVSNFPTRSVTRSPYGLSHNGNWKESEEKLVKVAIKILETFSLPS